MESKGSEQREPSFRELQENALAALKIIDRGSMRQGHWFFDPSSAVEFAGRITSNRKIAEFLARKRISAEIGGGVSVSVTDDSRLKEPGDIRVGEDLDISRWVDVKMANLTNVQKAELFKVEGKHVIQAFKTAIKQRD